MLEIPAELVALISAGVIFLVTEGLKTVGAWLKVDISGVGSVIAAAFSTAVIAFLNGLLGTVPVEYAETVRVALLLLVSILGAFGIHRRLAAAKG